MGPEVIRLLEQDPGPFVDRRQTKHFQYVIVSIEDTAPNDIADTVDRVADTSIRHGAMLSNVSATIIISCLGIPSFPQFDSVNVRMDLVRDLLAENQARVRIAHGHCDGLVGSFGTRRFVYQGLIPGFSAILKKLLETPFGNAIEITNDSQG